MICNQSIIEKKVSFHSKRKKNFKVKVERVIIIIVNNNNNNNIFISIWKKRIILNCIYNLATLHKIYKEQHFI